MNRLQYEHSPYLKQHASNPVDWYPWGDLALERARTHNKPIFLSIGYATCHWCHVMEHECFSDDDVARLLNEYFVCIKVDREERPDIDMLYMKSAQALNGGGGWPLNLVLTPMLEAIYAATYIPKYSAQRTGMLELLPAIHNYWQHEQAKIQLGSGKLNHQLQNMFATPEANQPNPSSTFDFFTQQAFAQLDRSYDPKWGGFGHAPKFPSPHILHFLWQVSSANNGGLRKIYTTLLHMARGGLWDHLGGGFARYSVDERWEIPHFEKMLYDQAGLLQLYARTCATNNHEYFAYISSEVVRFVMEHLQGPNSLWYCAMDADSEGEEGRFYTWSWDELSRELTSAQLQYLHSFFDLNPAGNFQDPHSTSPAKIHLHRGEIAPIELGCDSWLPLPLNNILKKLEVIRSARIHPITDTKHILDWNAWWITSLLRSALALNQPQWQEHALASLEYALTHFTDSQGGLLHCKGENSHTKALLDDYAFTILALLQAWHNTGGLKHLSKAIELMDTAIAAFGDANGGFYFCPIDSELPVRPKEYFDGAMPSGNSIMAENLNILYAITAQPRYKDLRTKLFHSATTHLKSYPSGFCALLTQIERSKNPPPHWIISCAPQSTIPEPWLQTLLRAQNGMEGASIFYLNHTTLHFCPEYLQGLPLPTEGIEVRVCNNFTCQPPLRTLEELKIFLNSNQ
jgi:uncharacterized protein